MISIPVSQFDLFIRYVVKTVSIIIPTGPDILQVAHPHIRVQPKHIGVVQSTRHVHPVLDRRDVDHPAPRLTYSRVAHPTTWLNSGMAVCHERPTRLDRRELTRPQLAPVVAMGVSDAFVSRSQARLATATRAADARRGAAGACKAACARRRVADGKRGVCAGCGGGCCGE